MYRIRLNACGLAVAAAFSAPAFAAPTVKWVTPSDGKTLSGYINGKSECSVSGSRIDNVRFYLDDTFIGSDGNTGNGITCRFESTQFKDGAHTLKAVAADSRGATTSATININIKNGTTVEPTPQPTPEPTPEPSTGTAPTISFSAPAEGGTLSGNVQGPPNCVVSGTNIARVMFYLNEQWTNTDGNLDNGLGCWIDTTKYKDGTYTVKAVAYNSAGETATATRSIKIQNTVAQPANTPPTVTITTPEAGATLKGYVNSTMCVANASDADGIEKVEWYLNDKLVKSDGTNPYQCNIETTLYKDGTYQLIARAVDRKGGVATAQREVKILNGLGADDPTTPPPSTGSIDAADILGAALADVPFAQQSGYNAQVLGTYPGVSSIPESGIHASVLSNGESLRLGKQADPANSARQALAFQLAPSDPDTSGSKRSEFKFPNNIEFDKTYWTAFKVFVYDWGQLASNDISLFGTQLHSGDSSAGYSPSFGLFVVGSGRNFTVRVRGEGLSSKIDYATQPIPFGRWVDFVFKVRQSTGSGGVLQAWMDGQQIVNHSGPIGYKTSYRDYFKYGYYNWSSFNSSRKVLLRNPVIVADPTGSKYGPDALRSFVNQ